MTYDVIIVGARCAGAPMAMLLARAGHTVLLVDRATFPSDTMSTHWILRPGVELLDTWGLLDRVVATGCPPIDRISMDLEGFVLAGAPTTATGPAVTYAPRRTHLDALLVDAARAAGAEVREGLSVREVLWRDGRVVGVAGQDRDGRSVTAHARVVVGADGRNSTVARAVESPATTDRGALAATAYGYWSGLPVSGTEVRVTPRAGMSMWPTNDGLTVVGLTLPREVYLADRRGAESVYRGVLRSTPELAERVRPGRLASPVRGAANLRNFYRGSHGPGWALAGDAGYQTDPIGARGISDAFTDAQNLASSLDAGLTGALPMERSLARYEMRRNAGRAAAFEFICRQASLASPDEAFARVLRGVSENPEAAVELVNVFAGSRRIEAFFAPANLARLAARSGGASSPRPKAAP